MRYDPSLNVAKFDIVSRTRVITANEVFQILPNAPQRIWARIHSHGGGILQFSISADPQNGPRLAVIPNTQDASYDFTYESMGPIVQAAIFCYGNTAGMTVSITTVSYFPER